MAESTDSPRDRRRAAGLSVLLVATTLLVGCGGGSPLGARSERTTGTTAPTVPALPPSHGGRGTLPSLDQVPQEPTGPADAAARRVAEAWFDRVRRGDDEAAAALMVDGTRFVNGSIVILHDRGARVAAARRLPCGARPVAAGEGKGGYVVLELRLTPKAGAGRCDGEGAPVTVAVHVRDGRIDDWVRVNGTGATPDLGPEI